MQPLDQPQPAAGGAGRGGSGRAGPLAAASGGDRPGDQRRRPQPPHARLGGGPGASVRGGGGAPASWSAPAATAGARSRLERARSGASLRRLDRRQRHRRSVLPGGLAGHGWATTGAASGLAACRPAAGAAGGGRRAARQALAPGALAGLVRPAGGGAGSAAVPAGAGGCPSRRPGWTWPADRGGVVGRRRARSAWPVTPAGAGGGDGGQPAGAGDRFRADAPGGGRRLPHCGDLRHRRRRRWCQPGAALGAAQPARAGDAHVGALRGLPRARLCQRCLRRAWPPLHGSPGGRVGLATGAAGLAGGGLPPAPPPPPPPAPPGPAFPPPGAGAPRPAPPSPLSRA